MRLSIRSSADVDKSFSIYLNEGGGIERIIPPIAIPVKITIPVSIGTEFTRFRIIPVKAQISTKL